MRQACALALANTGKSMAARMAMIATTTSSSIRVNPPGASVLSCSPRLRLQKFLRGFFTMNFVTQIHHLSNADFCQRVKFVLSGPEGSCRNSGLTCGTNPLTFYYHQIESCYFHRRARLVHRRAS